MPTLVLVHLGEQWPHYLKDCIKQARLINPSTNIVLLVNKCQEIHVLPLQVIYKITVNYVEDLPKTAEHAEFLERIVNQVDLQFRKKYWQYVFERFFVLHQYCLLKPSQSVYMIETDNMVYVPLDIVQKTESLFSQGMAAPFDNLEQGYPSFVFFRNSQAIFEFVSFMLTCLRRLYLSDMKIMALYRINHPDKIFTYPVLPDVCNRPLRERSSLIGHKASAEETAFLSKKEFPILFDAMAYGQALGGIDPRNTGGVQSVGYINESALYSIQETQFAWTCLHGLWFPLVNSIPLVNLHIHSKALSEFLSDRQSVPKPNYNPSVLEQSLDKDFSLA